MYVSVCVYIYLFFEYGEEQAEPGAPAGIAISLVLATCMFAIKSGSQDLDMELRGKGRKFLKASLAGSLA